MIFETDVLVIGCGIAGCITALELAEQGFDVTLLGSGSFKDSNSYSAQGGIIYLGKEDSKELLAKDIFEAGAGLCNPKAVEQLAMFGPKFVKELLLDKYGVNFDQVDDGFSLAKEAAHSCSRVLHTRDQTGAAIMSTLFERVEKNSKITCRLGHSAVDLITLSHHSKKLTDLYSPSTCVGAYVLNHQSGCVDIFFAKETILATGGLGEVFLHTTNPKEAKGDGVAMAFRAGARIMNMEYVQFHPTALYVPTERRFLISEALRGEGAELLSNSMSPFMEKYHPLGSLAPRNVVARAMYQEMLSGSTPHLWLDISFKDRNWLQERFPFIHKYCLSKGLDFTKQPLPVVPAAHYSCGGVSVDEKGRTSICRLRAIGEVACSGLHGANRLASTSLLEGLVWGKMCADDLSQSLSQNSYYFPPVEEWVMGNKPVDSALIQQDWMTIKQTMWNYVGLQRDGTRLRRALKMLDELSLQIKDFYEHATLTPELLGLRNGVQTALLITQGAYRNKNSLGCHYRIN
jgi:L-aspartate oxidase